MTGPSVPTPIRKILGYCEHGDAVLSRNAGNNGIGFFCDECRSWVVRPGFDKLWIPKDHPKLRGVDLPNLPTVGLKTYRLCQGPCKSIAHCQLHHTAPRAFFGDDCDEWPMVWLCPACHTGWHAIVTPGLCTTYEADQHASQLIATLKLERVEKLTRHLINGIKALRAGAA